jgi:hypothetical protein
MDVPSGIVPIEDESHLGQELRNEQDGPSLQATPIEKTEDNGDGSLSDFWRFSWFSRRASESGEAQAPSLNTKDTAYTDKPQNLAAVSPDRSSITPRHRVVVGQHWRASALHILSVHTSPLESPRRHYQPTAVNVCRETPGRIQCWNDVALDSRVADRDIARQFDARFGDPLLDVLKQLQQEGYNFTLGSGCRRLDTQKEAGRNNPYAASGENSKHLSGCAADIFYVKSKGHTKADFYRRFHDLAEQNGLQVLRGNNREAPHVQMKHTAFLSLKAAGQLYSFAHQPRSSDGMMAQSSGGNAPHRPQRELMASNYTPQASPGGSPYAIN